MLRTIYKLEVQVPEEISHLYWSSCYYDKIPVAKRHSTSSGTEFVEDIITEWATFDVLEDAEDCERRLIETFESLKLLVNERGF